MPLKFILSEGQAHDSRFAERLVDAEQSEYLLADKAYDSDELRGYLKENETQPVIPSKSNRVNPIPHDKYIL